MMFDLAKCWSIPKSCTFEVNAGVSMHVTGNEYIGTSLMTSPSSGSGDNGVLPPLRG